MNLDSPKRISGDGGKPGNLLHGWSGTATYLAWSDMKERCRNPRSAAFKHYGGRGIDYCDAWSSFTAFLGDMGPRPEGMSLDRIDNNAGYCLANCRWASREEQRNNRRCTVMVPFRDGLMPLSEACSILGIKRHPVYKRIMRGWDPEKALAIPLVAGSKKRWK